MMKMTQTNQYTTDCDVTVEFLFRTNIGSRHRNPGAPYGDLPSMIACENPPTLHVRLSEESQYVAQYFDPQHRHTRQIYCCAPKAMMQDVHTLQIFTR